MALINSSYFVGPINIPNTNKTEISEQITFFAEKYENELLRDLFGYELSKNFTTGTEDFDPDGSNATVDQRYLDLIEGVDFTNRQNRPDRFEGLPAIVANYVYWMLITNNQTQTVGLGEVAALSENAESASPAMKLVNAWNEMSDRIAKLYEFCLVKIATYPELNNYNYHQMINKYCRNTQALWGF